MAHAYLDNIAKEKGLRPSDEIHFYDQQTGQFVSFYKDGLFFQKTDRSWDELEAYYPEAVVSPKNLAGKKVLDLGCGEGQFVRNLRSKGIDAYGVDLFLKDRSALPPFITKQDVMHMKFGDDFFDVFFSTWVLIKGYRMDREFVSDALRETCRVAKNGARIHISPVTLPRKQWRSLIDSVRQVEFVECSPIEGGSPGSCALTLTVVK